MPLLSNEADDPDDQVQTPSIAKEPRRQLTTTLPEDVIRELDQAARETGMKKNSILEEAITDFLPSIKAELKRLRRSV